VAECRHYNCSADVFSFGILLWEILSLKDAFGRYLTRLQYYNRVSLGGERPPVNKNWPPLTRQMMQEAWSTNPKQRPVFKRVAGLIHADLTDMTHDSEVVNRTNHMMRRSIRSVRGTQGSTSTTRSSFSSTPMAPAVKSKHNRYSLDYRDEEC
jgi:hypothetical protein